MTRLDRFFFTLHTDSPGQIGARPTNEISYPGYARVPAERAQPEYLGWILAGMPVYADSRVRISFPPASGTEVSVARHWGACSADGMLVFAGTLSQPITISGGVTPQVQGASLHDIARVIEENLRSVARLLTPQEAARIKQCVKIAEDEGLLERGPNFDWLTQSGGEERAALDAAIDRVTSPTDPASRETRIHQLAERLSRLKHGPKGTGRAGACEPDCVKCQLENELAQLRAQGS